MEGVGCEVWGVEFGQVQGSRFRVSGFGSRVWGLGFRKALLSLQLVQDVSSALVYLDANAILRCRLA